MYRIVRNLAVGTTLAAAALAVPVAAQAADTIYPPAGSCSVAPATTTPGGTVQFSCIAGTFSPTEKVTITVTGENGGGATVGFVRFAVTTASADVESTADGSLAATAVKLPADATGTYNLAAVSETSAGGTATVSVTAANTSGLPATGIDSGSLLGLWVGGGALVLAGGALAVGATVRRQRRAQG